MIAIAKRSLNPPPARLPFDEAFQDITGGQPKLQQRQYQKTGRFPIVDQGASPIGGYTDDELMIAKVPTPAILFGDHTKLFKWIEQPFVLGADGVKILAPCANLHPRYAFHFLQTVRLPDDVGYSRHFKFLRRIEVPVPKNKDEQIRIAIILDKADAVRRKRRQALAEIDTILRSTFLSMFGDPVTNSRGWDLATIEKCLVEIQAGWSAKGADRPANDGEYGVLKISAVTSGVYLPEENKAVADIPIGFELVTPHKGDLLFSRANTRDLVAATCLVDRTTENLFLPDKLWRLVPNTKIAMPEYIRFVLAHNEYRARLCAKATGTSGSMLNISQSKLLQHPIPLPDIGIQLAFSRVYKRLSEVREQQVHALNSSESFFASLSYNAFQGHL